MPKKKEMGHSTIKTLEIWEMLNASN